MGTNSKVIRTYQPVIGQVTVQRVTLQAQSIADVQNAINSARNIIMPRRKQLYELYENLVLDGHLTSVLGKRTSNVTNKRVMWVEDGATDEQTKRVNAEIIETPWFYDFLSLAMEVVPYGTTLIELQPVKGMIGKCEVIPRANVVPELGHIAKDATNPSEPWLMYRDDPKYRNYLIEVGRPKDLGAMMIALPYILYKRGALGDWAQFAELFGMPFRTGKYDAWDEKSRQKLLTALSEMGGAGYAVIPEGTSIEFTSTNSGQNQGGVYSGLGEFCNSEMSKLFLGQTMTTDNGSSRSQGEVHERVEDGITLSDMRRMEFLLNWELKPRLEALGYPVTKGKFQFEQTRNLSLVDRIEIDVKVAEQLGGLPEHYWRDTYGIPEPTPEEVKRMKERTGNGRQGGKGKPPAKQQGDKGDDETDGDSAALRTALHALYEGCEHTHTSRFVAAEKGEESDRIMEELAKAIHDGRIRDGWVDPKLMKWTAEQLTYGVMAGFTEDDSTAPESEALQAFMERNVMVFSGFKTYHTLRAATDELVDDEGNFRSFSDFKKRVIAIDQEYNKDYLRSEYELAVASGQMAERWGSIQEDKELFPFLKFRTAGDDRVRESHAKLDGVVRHVDDGFWDTYYPPLGWRCRCDVEQVRRLSGEDKTLRDDELPAVPPMFSNNVGKNGVVFPKGHPYYSAPAAIVKEVDKIVEEVLPAPVATVTKPAGPAVSASLTTKSRGLKADMKRTLAMIDKVHGDGVLKAIEMKAYRGDAFGVYRSHKFANSEAIGIEIRTSGNHKLITMAHEIGHWLDHIGLGNQRGIKFGSYGADPDMKPVMALLNESKAMRAIRTILSEGSIQTKEGHWVPVYGNLEDHLVYLLRPQEQWARAYSQYIAVRSGDPEMMKQLAGELANGDCVQSMWDDEEFKPIADAIDVFFRTKGWQQD